MAHNNYRRKHKKARQFLQKPLEIILLVLVLLILIGSGFAYGVTKIMNSVIVGNIPPVANDDAAVTNEYAPVDIDVVVNDTVSDGYIDTATVVIASNPANGAAESNSDGTVTYTPDAGFAGTDSFTYTVLDNEEAISNEAIVTVAVVEGAHVFTAYNDLSWSTGEANTRITLYTTGQNGLLKDYFTGTNTPVTLTIAGGYIDYCNTPVQGSNANSGTDAYAVFNGIVNSEGLISYSGPNLTFTFTGLDPNLNYEFVLFGNRNNTSYTNRMTTTTISEVESFTNASTPSTDFSGETDPAVTIVNGYNTVNGYVARFININAGADGDMLIIVSSPTGQFYVNVLMLRATQPSDTVCPRVSATNPALNATGVSVNIKEIKATFSEAMDADSITTSTFLVSDGIGCAIEGQVDYCPGDMTAIFKPASSLSYATMYTATITTEVRDIAGNAMLADYTWDFTTEAMFDETSPEVSGTNPVNGATRVSINIKEIKATFSEAMDADSITTSTFLVSDGIGCGIEGQVDYCPDDMTVIFKPANPLSYATKYTATIATGVRDVAGNAMLADYTWSFITGIDEYPWGFEACYAFDEGTGEIATDSSGNGMNGTVHGATWTTGKIGGALNFEGDDYVTIPCMNYDEISVSAWFNKNASGTNVIFGGFKYNANVQCQEGFDLYFNSGTPNRLRFVVVTRNTSGTRTVKDATKDFTDSNGSWYHVVGTYNKTTGEQKLYVDGQLVDTQTHPSGNVIVPLTERNYMAIGTRYTDWGFFCGSLDDVRIYNHALDAGEVLALLSEKVWIREGDEWRYFKGVQEPTSEWNQSGFDDSIWQIGPSGFGYGREGNSTNLDDMQDNYLTVYVRRDFIVNDPNAVINITLSVECDGPFIAYLNGIEIIRNETGLKGELLDVSGFIEELFPGENILAVEGSNDDINSDSFSFTPEFELTERLDK